jgi:hypothetical protein
VSACNNGVCSATAEIVYSYCFCIDCTQQYIIRDIGMVDILHIMRFCIIIPIYGWIIWHVFLIYVLLFYKFYYIADICTRRVCQLAIITSRPPHRQYAQADRHIGNMHKQTATWAICTRQTATWAICTSRPPHGQYALGRLAWLPARSIDYAWRISKYIETTHHIIDVIKNGWEWWEWVRRW